MGFLKRVERDIKKVEKEIDEDLDDVEAWIKERKKFFIKLLWIIAIIAVILVVASVINA